MPLRVAVQMDPLEGINISGDSTFAIMLGAQALGHQLFHYLAEDLTYQDGRLYAGAHGVTVQPVTGDHFKRGDFVILDLGRDVDVVLMRQDPPFDLGYITATHLLERIQHETLVVNDPAGVRDAPEKVFVLDFAQYMPPTMITRSVGAAKVFLAEHGSCVLKPLHGNAGKAVFKIEPDGGNLAPLMELLHAHASGETLPDAAGEPRARDRTPGRPRPPADDPTPEQAAMYGKLKKLRSELARELKQPAYCVFSDRTLIEIARAHPTSERGLLSVSGVGPAKLEKFGEAFLRVLRGESLADVLGPRPRLLDQVPGGRLVEVLHV